MKNLNQYLGKTVAVTPKKNDIFCHEFQGTVVGIKCGLYLEVCDQEGDVFDVDEDQVTLVKDELFAFK